MNREQKIKVLETIRSGIPAAIALKYADKWTVWAFKDKDDETALL